MAAFRPRIRPLAVGVGAFALVAVGAGGTFAASNPATLYACYDVYGNVRMSDTAQCKLPGGGRLVSWSTVGVPGPTGATGVTGPTGATGSTGPSGPSDVRAYAAVEPDGTAYNSRSVDSVTRVGTGEYCVHVTGGAPGYYPASVLPNAPGYLVWAPAIGGSCTSGTSSWGPEVYVTDLAGNPVDGGFSIVIFNS
jgi:hypothetical protein